MRHWLPRIVVGVATLLAANAPAFGDAIDLVSTTYTVSTQGAVNVNGFSVSGPGTVTLTLTDLHWPTALAQMSYLVATTTGTVLGLGSGFGTETFQVSGPATLYAVTYGQAAPLPGLAFGYGSYGVSASFQAQAVPLPPSAVLLASAAAFLWVRSRRRERQPAARSWTDDRFAIKL